MVNISWLEESFCLHPSRCLFRDRDKTLIISDLHIGKTGHFRKEGIPVPQQLYKEDLIRLFDAIRFFKPREIIIAGDLFHSKSNKEWDIFCRWRSEISSIKISLILGNHDKIPTEILPKLNMEISAKLIKENLLFVHDATEAGNLPQGINGIVSGHIHPAVRIPAGLRQSIHLPCFHFAKNCCTLPAFSLFTGTHTIRPTRADKVYAITPTGVLAVQ